MYTIGGVIMHKDKSGNMLMHSAKGQEWDQHKYIDKVKGKDGKWHYIYNESKSPVAPTINEIEQLKSEGVEFNYDNVKGRSNSVSLSEVKQSDINKAQTEIENMLKYYGSGQKKYLSYRALNAIKNVLQRALTGELGSSESGSRNKSSRRA